MSPFYGYTGMCSCCRGKNKTSAFEYGFTALNFGLLHRDDFLLIQIEKQETGEVNTCLLLPWRKTMNSICSTKDFPESDKDRLLCPAVLFKCQVSAWILLLFFGFSSKRLQPLSCNDGGSAKKLYWTSFVIN